MRQYFLNKAEHNAGVYAEWSGSSTLKFKDTTEEREIGSIRGGASRRKEDGDGSSRGRRREPDVGTAFVRVFESLNSESPRKRDARGSFGSEIPYKAVVEATR